MVDARIIRGRANNHEAAPGVKGLRGGFLFGVSVVQEVEQELPAPNQHYNASE
jgi:hypothetical protein